jgi:thiamine pyrophosphokinase
MSSHHIIRDEQEPPVLVFELFDNWNELSELLGWSPVLLINPDLKELFEMKQTKIDGFLANEEGNHIMGNNNLVYNSSNLALTLKEWIIGKKYTGIYIFCDTDLMISLFKDIKEVKLSIPLIFFTEKGKYTLIQNSRFKKWYPKNYKIEILNDDILDVKNLKMIKNSFYLKKDGFINIEVKGDSILIKEQ